MYPNEIYSSAIKAGFDPNCEEAIKELTPWQRDRFALFLTNKRRTMPRSLFSFAKKPDLREPWRQDAIEDVKDCFAHLKQPPMTRATLKMLNTADVKAVDRWVQEFWFAIDAAKTPPAWPESFEEARSEIEVQDLAIVWPSHMVGAKEIQEDIKQLTKKLEQFQASLATIAFKADNRSLRHVVKRVTLLQKLQRAGIKRVCELQYAITSGYLATTKLTPKERGECAAIVAQLTKAHFELLREVIDDGCDINYGTNEPTPAVG